MKSNDLLSRLNKQQAEAVRTIEGPVLVLAGAGTGKTQVITFRIAYMLGCGIAPQSILGMTFTNKAAREMRERLAQMVSAEAAQKLSLSTFHSFCARFLRREISVLDGFSSNFSIADASDQKALIKQSAGALGYSKDQAPVDDAAFYISSRKNSLIAPEAALESAETDRHAVFARIYAHYRNVLKLQNTLDFDDLLFFVCQILEEHKDIAEKYRARYKYLMVDEYQDTNDAQFELLKLLLGDNRNLCVVGDDDQSIYSWRGANVRNILDFPEHFKGAKEIKLEQNYRSTNKILEAANLIIGNNRDRYAKKLWSAMEASEDVFVVKSSDSAKEAEFIVDYVIDRCENKKELKYSDFAVLYRSNHLSRQIEKALREASVPYRLVGGQEFFQRKEVKDAVAYLRLIANVRDDQSLLRIIAVPPRGIGDKAIETLKELRVRLKKPMSVLVGGDDFLGALSGKGRQAANEFSAIVAKYRSLFAEGGNLALKMRDYLDEIGYLNGMLRVYRDRADAEKRSANVAEFINDVKEFENRNPDAKLSDYLESYSLLEENDRTKNSEENTDCVTLTTVHAAKGLEFGCVFVAGTEKHLFPHERSEAEGNLEEERRLFYVALTRAKERLFVLHSEKRLKMGRESMQSPSRFIDELPEDIAVRVKSEDLFEQLDEDELMAKFKAIYESL